MSNDGEAQTRPDAEGRVLRVFFDWGHVWPLWESGSDKLAMEPTDYGYSTELTDLLRRWQTAWMPVADFNMGETEDPPSATQYDLYEQFGKQALEGILRETPLGVAVQIEEDLLP